MKSTIKRTLLFALAALLVLCFAGAALAQSDDATPEPAGQATAAPQDEGDADKAKDGEAASATEDGQTSTESPAPTESTGDFAMYVVDENGKRVTVVYIDHYYEVYIGHSDGTYAQAGNVTLSITSEIPQEYQNVIYLKDNRVIVDHCDKAMSIIISLDVAGAEETQEGTISIVKYTFEFLDLILGGIGLYVLISAILGKGALFKNEFLKEGTEEDFKKWVRICSITSGVALIGYTVLAVCFGYLDWTSICGYVLFGIGIIALVAILVISSRFTDKEKKNKAKAAAAQGGSGGNSSAAFEFDGTEPTIDEIIAQDNIRRQR